jgi:hypothetical protein
MSADVPERTIVPIVHDEDAVRDGQCKMEVLFDRKRSRCLGTVD